MSATNNRSRKNEAITSMTSFVLLIGIVSSFLVSLKWPSVACTAAGDFLFRSATCHWSPMRESEISFARQHDPGIRDRWPDAF